jgi:hypothetical protein
VREAGDERRVAGDEEADGARQAVRGEADPIPSLAGTASTAAPIEPSSSRAGISTETGGNGAAGRGGTLSAATLRRLTSNGRVAKMRTQPAHSVSAPMAEMLATIQSQGRHP